MDRQQQGGDEYPAEKARQGEIILRTTGARTIFTLGLALTAVAAVLAFVVAV